jgi:hypothetical protein
MPSFRNFLDELVAESLQVTRITRANNAPVVYDLAVLPDPVEVWAASGEFIHSAYKKG